MHKGDEIPQFAGSSISLQFRPILHVHIDEHREKKSCEGGSPLDPPSCPPRPIPFIYVHMWVKRAEKCYKKVSNFYAAFWTSFACKYRQTREGEKLHPTTAVRCDAHAALRYGASRRCPWRAARMIRVALGGASRPTCERKWNAHAQSRCMCTCIL